MIRETFKTLLELAALAGFMATIAIWSIALA